VSRSFPAPDRGPRSVPAGTLKRFWTMLGHDQGALLNASRLASGLQISPSTVQRYIDLLTDLLLVRQLMPFHRNLGKRLVKSRKVYVRDCGLAYALMGIEIKRRVTGRPEKGFYGACQDLKPDRRFVVNAGISAHFVQRPKQQVPAVSKLPESRLDMHAYFPPE
jgi:hypothetical protein